MNSLYFVYYPFIQICILHIFSPINSRIFLRGESTYGGAQGLLFILWLGSLLEELGDCMGSESRLVACKESFLPTVLCLAQRKIVFIAERNTHWMISNGIYRNGHQILPWIIPIFCSFCAFFPLRMKPYTQPIFQWEQEIMPSVVVGSIYVYYWQFFLHVDVFLLSCLFSQPFIYINQGSNL